MDRSEDEERGQVIRELINQKCKRGLRWGIYADKAQRAGPWCRYIDCEGQLRLGQVADNS